MPGAHIYVVIAIITHILEIHDIVPGCTKTKMEDDCECKKGEEAEVFFFSI